MFAQTLCCLVCDLEALCKNELVYIVTVLSKCSGTKEGEEREEQRRVFRVFIGFCICIGCVCVCNSVLIH